MMGRRNNIKIEHQKWLANIFVVQWVDPWGPTGRISGKQDRNVVLSAISRKVVGRNVHPTIPKHNEYEQCTVPDTIALEPILLLLIFGRFGNILPWPLVPFFQISPEEQWTQNHPQYLSRNSCIHEANYAGADVPSGGRHDECGGLQRQWR